MSTEIEIESEGAKEREIDALKDYVVSRVPFYQKLRGIQKFSDLPLVTKSLIKRNYSDFLALEDEESKKHVLGIANDPAAFSNKRIIEKKGLYNIIFERTSGSSGIPFVSIKTIQERRLLALSHLRMRQRIDYKFRPGSMCMFNHFGFNLPDFSVVDYSRENLSALYQKLRDDKTRWLHAPPKILKKHLAVEGITDMAQTCETLQFVECNGHFLRPEDAGDIRKMFPTATIVDMYGLIETWGVAWKIEEGAYTLISPSVHLEIVDEEGKALNQPQIIGRVVVTSTVLRTMPIVRFLTGDYGFWEQAGDSRSFRLIQGRDINLIKGDREGRFGNVVFENVLVHVFNRERFPELNFIQIRQVKDTEFVVLTSGFEKNERKERFLSLFREVAAGRFTQSINIRSKTLCPKELSTLEAQKPMLFLNHYNNDTAHE